MTLTDVINLSGMEAKWMIDLMLMIMFMVIIFFGIVVSVYMIGEMRREKMIDNTYNETERDKDAN